MRKRRLLGACIVSSLCIHALALFLLQSHYFWFSPPLLHSSSRVALNTLQKGEILKETFQTLAKAPSPQNALPQMLSGDELFREYSFPDIPLKEREILFSNPFQSQELLASNSETPALQLFSEPPSLTLFPSDTLLPTFPAPSLSPSLIALPFSHPEPLGPPLFDKPPSMPLLSPTPSEPSYSRAHLDFGFWADEGALERASLSIATPPLPAFPTLAELDTSAIADSFDVEVLCLPKQDSPGYLFALTLIPHPDLQLPKFRQNYTFLLDRSNSIQRDRLNASKLAVLRALEECEPGDSFNVYVFDSKVEKLFPQAQTKTDTSLAQAKTFLEKVQLGSFLSPGDAYHPLLLTLPSQIQDDEIHTAILLTDGETLAKKNAARTLLYTWTAQNNGRVSLFTIGMENDPQLATLDVASMFNKGRLYYSSTKRGIKRKLLKLMKNIHTPIAKNISCTAITRQSRRNQIELYPKSLVKLPHLYLDQPLVILGSCDLLDDFVLFVQGRLQDRWLNIKKTITFINAKQGGTALKQEWALQQAYQCYERYLLDQNQDHLTQAKVFLKPFALQPAL
jgi:hypothetical protein